MKKNEPKLVCFFDGACAPINPNGHIGYGWVITENGVVIAEKSGYIPQKVGNTNNIAEYMALNDLLAYLLTEGLNGEEILICGDSNLAVMQMTGKWKIKFGAYKPYALECKELLTDFTNVSLRWISRDLNTLADTQSKKGFLERGIADFTDKKPNANQN